MCRDMLRDEYGEPLRFTTVPGELAVTFESETTNPLKVGSVCDTVSLSVCVKLCKCEIGDVVCQLSPCCRRRYTLYLHTIILAKPLFYPYIITIHTHTHTHSLSLSPSLRFPLSLSPSLRSPL